MYYAIVNYIFIIFCIGQRNCPNFFLHSSFIGEKQATIFFPSVPNKPKTSKKSKILTFLALWSLVWPL